jgi:hypothetical protein
VRRAPDRSAPSRSSCRCQLDAQIGDEIVLVFGAAIEFAVALLAAVPLTSSRHAVDATSDSAC